MQSDLTTVADNLCKSTSDSSANRDHRFEMRLWIIMLVLANFGLLFGQVPATNLMFDPAAVAAGEWWRVLTWPLAHVSRYHLLLDGSAFLLLYTGFEERLPLRRLGLVFFTAAGSLLLPLAIAPEIYRYGLCGLSGIAHGLATASALEMLRHRQLKRIGSWLLSGLLLKSCWELLSGTAFLQHLHLGDIGQPIVATHAGGVIGGLLGYIFIRLLANSRSSGG